MIIAVPIFGGVCLLLVLFPLAMIVVNVAKNRQNLNGGLEQFFV